MNMPLEHDFAALDAWAARHGCNLFPDHGEERHEPQEPSRRYQLLTPAQLAEEPRTRWLVKPILPQTGLAAVYGAPGCGKSFLVLDLLAAVAEGQAWFGHRVPEARPVVYLALEGQGGLADRSRAWEITNGRSLPDNFHFIKDAFDLRSPCDREDLAEAIRMAGAAGGILCLDTLNRASPGADENAGPDMGLLVAGATELASELGALALLVHHVGKDSSKGLRGHSSLLGALDAALEVSRNGDVRCWNLAKSKDGQDGLTGLFRLASLEVGTDDDGEPVTSCAVEAIQPEDTSPMVRRPAKPKAGNRRIVFDKLGELLRRAGDRRPDDAPASLPPGRPVVRIEDVVLELGEALPVEPKRRNERVRGALASLIAEGHYKAETGFVWSP